MHALIKFDIFCQLEQRLHNFVLNSNLCISFVLETIANSKDSRNINWLAQNFSSLSQMNRFYYVMYLKVANSSYYICLNVDCNIWMEAFSNI